MDYTQQEAVQNSYYAAGTAPRENGISDHLDAQNVALEGLHNELSLLADQLQQVSAVAPPEAANKAAQLVKGGSSAVGNRIVNNTEAIEGATNRVRALRQGLRL